MSDLRNQTMNRLNEASFCMPSAPMPAPVMPLSIFEEMMYKVAHENGYAGTKTEFSEGFVNSLIGNSNTAGIIVQKGSVSDFPEQGLENAIYIDTENNHIYYWKNNSYYRINIGSESGLKEGTILHGGDAETI